MPTGATFAIAAKVISCSRRARSVDSSRRCISTGENESQAGLDAPARMFATAVSSLTASIAVLPPGCARRADETERTKREPVAVFVRPDLQAEVARARIEAAVRAV